MKERYMKDFNGEKIYCLEYDKETLREMLTFVTNQDGRMEAMSGKHDDLVMASAIAHWVSISQGDFSVKQERKGILL